MEDVDRAEVVIEVEDVDNEEDVRTWMMWKTATA